MRTGSLDGSGFMKNSRKFSKRFTIKELEFLASNEKISVTLSMPIKKLVGCGFVCKEYFSHFRESRIKKLKMC